MKAILIDSHARRVESIELREGSLEEIYAAVRCQCIEGVNPRVLSGRDVIFVDERGMLDDPQVFFQITGWPDIIAGNGLVCGSDEEGDTVDCVTPLDVVCANVRFVLPGIQA